MNKTYTTKEACKKIGISRQTIITYFQNGLIKEPGKDRFGYRVFDEGDIKRIMEYKNKKRTKGGTK